MLPPSEIRRRGDRRRRRTTALVVGGAALAAAVAVGTPGRPASAAGATTTGPARAEPAGPDPGRAGSPPSRRLPAGRRLPRRPGGDPRPTRTWLPICGDVASTDRRRAAVVHYTGESEDRAQRVLVLLRGRRRRARPAGSAAQRRQRLRPDPRSSAAGSGDGWSSCDPVPARPRHRGVLRLHRAGPARRRAGQRPDATSRSPAPATRSTSSRRTARRAAAPSWQRAGALRAGLAGAAGSDVRVRRRPVRHAAQRLTAIWAASCPKACTVDYRSS